MTVSELRVRLAECPDEMLVGAFDQDDELCEVQVACAASHHITGEQIFLIRANGGFPLISVD